MPIFNNDESLSTKNKIILNANIKNHASKNIRSPYHQINYFVVKLFVLFNLVILASGNNIFMSISSTNSSVGALSNYTINFNRSLNSLGQTIISSNLNSNYLIAVVFDAAYNLNTSISMTPNNYTVSTSTQTVTLTLSATISSI